MWDRGTAAEAHLGTVSPRNAFLDPSLTLSPLDGGLQVFVKRPAELVFGRRAQYLLDSKKGQTISSWARGVLSSNRWMKRSHNRLVECSLARLLSLMAPGLWLVLFGGGATLLSGGGVGAATDDSPRKG
jgi:hypothetical protein